MLPINPNDELQLRQAKLQLKIDELSNMESWNSDTRLVSDSEIRNIIEESLKSLDTLPNDYLSSSLSNFIERVESEKFIEAELKELVSKVQNSVEDEVPIFPINKDTTLQVLEKMKIPDLSILSRVSHQANKMGNEAIIASIKKLGFEGDVYEEAVNYLKDIEFEISGLRALLPSGRSFDEFPAIKKLLNMEGMTREERIQNVLEGLKTLPNEELMVLCANNAFYHDNTFKFDKLRNFISLHYEIETPLNETTDGKKMQANALCLAAKGNDAGIVKLLLDLGVHPNSTYDDPKHPYSSFINKTALECAEISDNLYKDFRKDNYQAVIELLTEALRKTE